MPAAAPSFATPPDDFYAVPDPLPPGEPGDLIWAEAVALELDPPATVWRILYHSTSAAAEDIAVSGFAVVPVSPPPADGRDVYAWAHDTAGMGDQCAPSREVRDNLPPYGGLLVEQGAVLVATDYAGLGTSGLPSSLNGPSDARAVLDGVRAATKLPDVGEMDELVVAGHSQGGTAALFVGEVANSYAPELALVGVVSLAPGAEFTTFVDGLVGTPAQGLDLIGAAGVRAHHPEIDIAASLTPAAFADLAVVESECVDETVGRYASIPADDVFTRPPSSDPALAALLQENSPGSTVIAVPLFLGQGDADQEVQVDISTRLAASYCANGTSVTAHNYSGVDHEGVVDAAADDVLAFMTERYANELVADDCP